MPSHPGSTRSETDGDDSLPARFEALWRAGERPRIEDLIAGLAGPERIEAVCRLIEREFHLRRESGERPTATEYLARFPEASDVLGFFGGDDPSGETDPTAAGRDAPDSRPTDPSEVKDVSSDGTASRTHRASSGDRTIQQADIGLDDPARWPLLEDFEILEFLGRGGIGIVYRARDLELGREVAVKVLRPELAEEPGRVAAFRREATLAASLSDERILRVLRWVAGPKHSALVMEYVPGGDLKGSIQAQREDRRAQGLDHLGGDDAYLSTLLPMLDDLIGAVARVHGAKILHRDIKPSNVLVRDDGKVFLSDFGFARLMEGRPGDSTVTLGGTIGYTPIEQWEARDLDARADVFSLGATLYEAITLRLPYGKAMPHLQIRPPERPSRLCPGLSPRFDAVLLKALESDRERRYTNVEAFRKDWAKAREGLKPEARIRPFDSRTSRRRAGFLVAAITPLLALLFWYLPIVRPDPADSPPPGPPITNSDARLIRLPTGKETCSRFVMVPLRDYDGQPMPDRKIRSPKDPTARFLAPPGFYLVIVEWPDGSFHEVYRTVPGINGPSGLYGHLRYDLKRDPEGTPRLIPVYKPPADVTAGMALFPGGHPDLAGVKGWAAEAPPSSMVAPYFLDVAEITVKQYLKWSGWRRLPKRLIAEGAAPDDAVRYIAFHDAVDTLERLGKRLPDELEYLLAATNGGTTRYPWGDDPPVPWEDWPFGPPGIAGFDRTPTTPPVLGLYSNVAEWTMSLGAALGSGTPSAFAEEVRQLRVVRGAPESVIAGAPRPETFPEGPVTRIGRAMKEVNVSDPGIGFRGARSLRPRYLDPTPPP